MNQRAMETAFERSEAAFAHALERQRKLLDERINAIETQAAASVALRDLIALITDAPACRARILQLQKQADDARDLQARLAAERIAHDVKVAADLADLQARETRVRKREAEQYQKEIAERDAAEIRARGPGFDPLARLRRPGEFPEGSSITREAS